MKLSRRQVLEQGVLHSVVVGCSSLPESEVAPPAPSTSAPASASADPTASGASAGPGGHAANGGATSEATRSEQVARQPEVRGAPPETAASPQAEGTSAPPQAEATSASPQREVQDVRQPDGPQQSGQAALAGQVVRTRVGRNHGHRFAVPIEDVVAGIEKTYDLRGKGDHPHQVQITTQEFELLRHGEVLRKKSLRGGSNAHRHRLLLQVVPEVLPPEMVSACQVVFGGKDDHEVTITESHVQEGVTRTYDVQGVAGHTHQLTLTNEHFAQLRAGKKLDVLTGRGLLHFHHVYLKYPA